MNLSVREVVNSNNLIKDSSFGIKGYRVPGVVTNFDRGIGFKLNKICLTPCFFQQQLHLALQ